LAIAAFDPVILPFERDGAVFERDQPAVGDGDAMRIAGEIGQHGFGSAERSLGIGDPRSATASGANSKAGLPRGLSGLTVPIHWLNHIHVSIG
jgi:hypothetical protein